MSTYSQSLSAHIAGNMSSETEQRFQRRGQHVQTKLAGIATSIHIPTEGRQGWVMKMLVVLQKVVERLNESVKGGNSMEELSEGLENTETRRYFDECTKKFGINYDMVLDTTEEKDNFEEITKVVDEVFEEVKGMVQDNWIIQREKESRRLSRSRMVFDQTSGRRWYLSYVLEGFCPTFGICPTFCPTFWRTLSYVRRTPRGGFL